MKQQRRYDKEFKLKALELYQNGKSASDVCRDLGIPVATFWQWLNKLKLEGKASFVGSGKIKPVNEEAYRLRKELEDVKAERDILKKALAIFSKPKP